MLLIFILVKYTYFSRFHYFVLIFLKRLRRFLNEDAFQKLGFFCLYISSPEQLCSIVRASVIFFFLIFNRKLALESHVGLCFMVTLLLLSLKVGFIALVLKMFVFVVNFHRSTELV